MMNWQNADFTKPAFVKGTGASKRVIILLGGALWWPAKWQYVEETWIDDYYTEYKEDEVPYWIDPDMVLPYIPILGAEDED